MARKFYTYNYCIIDNDSKQRKTYHKSYIVGGSINDAKKRLDRITAEHNNQPQNRHRQIRIHSVKLDRKTTREWRKVGRL